MHSQLCMSEIWNESGGISLQAKRPLCTRGEFVHGCGSCGGSESVGADPVVPQAGHDSGVSTCSIGQPSSSLPVHELITSRQRTLNSSCCCYSFTNSFLTLWDPMDCSTPGSSVLHHLPDFAQMSIESVMPSNYLILYCPLLLLPSIFASIRVFSNDLALCIRWPKYWNFSFIIIPSKEYSGLISFRIDSWWWGAGGVCRFLTGWGFQEVGSRRGSLASCPEKGHSV